MSIPKAACLSEYLRFESRTLRQSHCQELSLRRDECEKSTLFQRHLPNGLGTASPPDGPYFLSLRPFSLQAGNCAVLVLSLGLLLNQAMRDRRSLVKFESVIG